MYDLTQAQINKLLLFRGYGNPNAKFWFVGMEEGGDPDNEDLQIKADRFETIEDLAESHSKFKSHNMSKLVPTWRLMSAIVGRIDGRTDWWDLDYAREYQKNRLGRPDGETYLTEILPLPKKGINHWPYGNQYGSPAEYRDRVLDDRLDLLRNDYKSASPKPEFVFCYGKDFWDEHRAAFDLIDCQAEMDGQIEWVSNQHSIFVLAKMFGYGWLGFTEEFVNDLCEFALSKSPR